MSEKLFLPSPRNPSFIPLSSGRGFTKHSPFSLASNVQQASRSRSAIGDGGNSCLDPTWADSGKICLNSEYNMHPVAFNLFVPSFMEFPYGNYGVSLVLSMFMLQFCLKLLHHVHNLIKPECYAVFIYILV